MGRRVIIPEREISVVILSCIAAAIIIYWLGKNLNVHMFFLLLLAPDCLPAFVSINAGRYQSILKSETIVDKRALIRHDSV